MSGGVYLDDDLIQVDALGKRWAGWGNDKGSPLHPLEAMRLLHDGAVLGGGPTGMPSDVKAWDICLEEAKADKAEEKAALLRIWYSRQGVSTQALADKLRVSRRSLYENWKQGLWYMKGALKVHGVKL